MQVEQIEEVAAIAQQRVEERPLGTVGGGGGQRVGCAAQHHHRVGVGVLDRLVHHLQLGDVLGRRPAHVSPTLQGSLSHCQ
jgi:hypothetical protein